MSCNRLLSRIAALAALFTAGVFADSLIYTRPLPSTLNTNISGANRSNTTFGNSGPSATGSAFLQGDSFVVPSGTYPWYHISRIAVWMIVNNTGDQPSDEFSSFVLYGGTDPGATITVAPFAQINIGQPTITRDYYLPSGTATATNCETGNGQDYAGQTSTACYGIFRLTFPVDLTLHSGTTYDFAADGFAKNPAYAFYQHFTATDSSIAGTSQSGATGHFLNWDASALDQGYYSMSSAAGCVANFNIGVACVSWANAPQDKATNVNVNVFGANVPEPATVGMLGAAFALLLVARQRK